MLKSKRALPMPMDWLVCKLEGVFAQIDWSKGPYFIKIETDPNGGTDYTIVGTSEMLSVPYALFALNAEVNDYLGTSNDVINLSILAGN